tara:strand:+ start:2415 stop:2606 length:192 start_codon:yes stop_codon:yes gene_type:complete
MNKTTTTQHYTDIELMAWADREARVDASKLTVADIATATVFVRTRRLLQRVAALDTNTHDDTR